MRFSLTSMRTSSCVLGGTDAFSLPKSSSWSASSKTMCSCPEEEEDDEDEDDDEESESESLKRKTGEMSYQPGEIH